MKTALFLILLMTTTSCGRKEVKKLQIDPEFSLIVEEFKANGVRAEKPTTIDNLIIKMVDNLDSLNSNGNTLGVCYESYRETSDILGNKKIYATPVIHVDRGDWNKLNSMGRKQLVFHELGHCILKLAHVNSTRSLMYPYHNSVQALFSTTNGYNLLVYELFHPKATVAAVGFQAINLASTMDAPEGVDSIELSGESLDQFAEVNMSDNEFGEIVHDENYHKVIRIHE